MDADKIRSEGAQLLAETKGEDQAGTKAPGEEGAPAAAAAPAGPSQLDLDRLEVQKWAGFPYVFGSIVKRAMPELAAVYSEAACLDWGEKMLPVAKHYGWTAGVAGMWAAVVGASISMLEPTAAAVVARRRAAAIAADAATRRASASSQAAVQAAGAAVTGTGTGTEGAPSGGEAQPGTG